MATIHGNPHPCELDPGIPTGMTQSLDYAIAYATINISDEGLTWHTSRHDSVVLLLSK